MTATGSNGNPFDINQWFLRNQKRERCSLPHYVRCPTQPFSHQPAKGAMIPLGRGIMNDASASWGKQGIISSAAEDDSSPTKGRGPLRKQDRMSEANTIPV